VRRSLPTSWRPWVAALLSALTPGAGHLYSGDVRGALLFWSVGIGVEIAIKVTYVLVGYSAAVFLTLTVAWAVGVIAMAAHSSWRIARSRAVERPALYQRIWVVLIAAFLVSEPVRRASRAWLLQPLYIPTEAMAPTLVSGDYVMVTKLGRRSAPERDALVAFLYDLADGQGTLETVKRVVAVAGDRVEVRDGRLRVNGEEVERGEVSGTVAELTVPPGHVYVLGDNARKGGVDSRSLGPISLERCIGRARGIYISGTLKRIGTSL
jgi:signal peptidase I